MNATDPKPAGPKPTGPTPTAPRPADPIARPVHRRRRRISTALAPVAILASLSVLAGCGTATTSATPKATKVAVPAAVPTSELASLTLNVGDQKGEQQALLEAAGELGDVPYQIKWATFTSGAPELEALNAGAIDFAATGNTPPIFSAAARGKIVIISAGKDTAGGDAVLVPKGSTVRTVADLRGKRVAVAKGSSAHGNLLLQLKKAGLKPADVQTTFLAPADGYAALSAGRVAAWVVWDPFTAQAEKQLGARVLASGKGVANGLGFQLASRAALADPRRNSAIEDYVARTVRAHLWSNANPEKWATVYAGKSGLPYEVALASAVRSDDDTILLTPEVTASEQKLADAFAEAKVIPTRPVIADLVDSRYNQTVSEVLAKK